MKRLLTTLTVAASFIAGGAAAFEINLSAPDTNKLLSKPMIQDLAVGVKALIPYYQGQCKIKGKLYLIGHSPLETDPSIYTSYYEITKQPDGEFTIKYGADGTGQKSLQLLNASLCADIVEGFPDVTLYPVKSVNGFTDQRSFVINLMNQGYK